MFAVIGRRTAVEQRLVVSINSTMRRTRSLGGGKILPDAVHSWGVCPAPTPRIARPFETRSRVEIR